MIKIAVAEEISLVATSKGAVGFENLKINLSNWLFLYIVNFLNVLLTDY